MSVAEKRKNLEGRMAEVQKQLGSIFEEAGPELDMDKVKSLDGDSAAKVDGIRKLNEELADIGQKLDDLKTLEQGVRNGVSDAKKSEAGAGGDRKSDDTNNGGQKQRKSFGELFTESDAFKVKGMSADLDVELKTLFDTSTGWAPDVVRGPRIVLDEQRPIQVAQLIPQTTTTQTAIAYMEETTFTNAAAETAEGAAKPEATLALTERTSTVRKIAVWIPVTEESMDDIPRFQQYLNNRLPFMVQQRLDLQIISGNGTAPNLRGVMNVAGIQTQAKGTDPVPDAIYKAIVKVRVTGQAEPDLVVIHPNDWQDIRLLRTADGIYIWGNPSEAGPERIWGLRAAVVQAATDGTAIVGDFGNFSELAVKKGLEVRMTDSHSTYFVENKLVVLAEMRAAFIVYRPTAFCTVTGI